MNRREVIPAMTAGACLMYSGAWAKEKTVFPPLPISKKELHLGTVEIDLRMMNGFVKRPQALQDFYVAGRSALATANPDQTLAIVCQKFGHQLIGVPMLGDVTHESVKVWLHLPSPADVMVTLVPKVGGQPEVFRAGASTCFPVIPCSALKSDCPYQYVVTHAVSKAHLGGGEFTTPPAPEADTSFQIAFGSDYHKVGLHRPVLMQLIKQRGNRSVVLTGDLATDDRKGDMALLAADYFLRDIVPSWQVMAANVPVYTSWDDHDYYDNDASGAVHLNKPIDVEAQRNVWRQQWNNPAEAGEGIYFDTQIGPVHLIMTDSRSCRVHALQGQRNSYLGERQMAWLKKTIKESTSPYIVLSGGTMWSDYISEAKDSWGVWDQVGREEIFKLIDAKKNTQVILLSGDRHGARGFAIPRPNGKEIYEFEAGTMGAIQGPKAMAPNAQDQLFGYDGITTWAFGELLFETVQGERQVTVKLVNDKNQVLESIVLKNGRMVNV